MDIKKVQNVPDEIREIQAKIILQAEKKGYAIRQIDALRLIAKSFKSK